MTEEHLNVINELRHMGYAVVLFSPDELKGANPDTIEDLMRARAWHAIDTLGD